MIKLFRAIRCEHRKLWSKNSTSLWLLLCLVFGIFITITLSAGMGYSNYDFDALPVKAHFSDSLPKPVDEQNWRSEAEAEVNENYEKWNALAAQLDEVSHIQQATIEHERELAARRSTIAAYRLEHNIAPEKGNMWCIAQIAIWLMMQLVCVICAIAASDMFAGEYSRGTIYMNLARPITRIKQYFAKMFTAWFYGFLLMLSSFVGIVAAGSIMLGDSGGTYLGFVNSKVYNTGWFSHCLTVFCCCMVSILLCNTLCAALGTLTRSRAVSSVGAIAVAGASVWLGGAAAPSLGIVSGISIISCFDLTVPLMAASNYPELSFADCCVSCIAHLLIFFLLGYYFMRRDIID